MRVDTVKVRSMNRRAFSLIELLASIGILAIMFGILLVALSAARASMRKATCLNHARQLALAIHTYHDFHRSMPPAVIWAPPGEPLGRGQLPIGVIDRVARTGQIENDTIYGNWAIALLPFSDQTALALHFNPNVPISAPENAEVRMARWSLMLCPSDPANGSGNFFRRGLARGLENNLYERGNWGINIGPDADCLNQQPTEDGSLCINGFIADSTNLITDNRRVWGSGVAGVNQSFRFANVVDGLSNTILLDEIRAGIDELDPRGVWALGQIGSSATARHGLLSDASGPNPLSPGSDEFMGCFALAQQHGIETLMLHGMGCALVTPDEEVNAQAGAKSLHHGGVNVALTDGSARFISDHIDKKVWHALHTRNGHEPVSEN